MMLTLFTVPPAGTVTGVDLAGSSAADEFAFQYFGTPPGIAIGGRNGPTLDPAVNPGRIDSTSTVYVPGGTGISKYPYSAGDLDPKLLPPALFPE